MNEILGEAFGLGNATNLQERGAKQRLEEGTLRNEIGVTSDTARFAQERLRDLQQEEEVEAKMAKLVPGMRVKHDAGFKLAYVVQHTATTSGKKHGV